jgi:hypothetical protein
MDGVILWVNQTEFKTYLNGKQFSAWNDQSNSENIQLIIPKSAILSFEESSSSLKFEIYEKSLW